ncbi:YkvA family protein [Pseudomonas sp. LFM046]|uniref:YkvA family protein n=1 Tax=Pseudomonas sp. LFM046 TaxID=1608357 RepID=UPI0005CF9DB9|nr:YkvA family protein [Pseudomonas sp. LFM046]
MNAPWNFQRYLTLAQRFLAGGRLPALLLAVSRKSASQSGRLGAVKEDLRLLLSLANAWVRGEYRQINPKAFLAVVGALLYFVTPLDALPDWLVGMGFVDDLAVLAWVLKTWSGELDAFRAWRNAQTPDVQAALERLPAPDGQ